MTYLPAKVMGRWFHLYLILDLYSRKIVGAEVHDSDDSVHAVHLVRRTALAMLNWLGIKPSYSRPRSCVGTTWSTATVVSAM